MSAHHERPRGSRSRWRGAVPVVVGIVVVVGALAGAGMVEDRDGLGTGPSRLQTDDGYACSATDDPAAPRLTHPGGFHDLPFDLGVTGDVSAPLLFTLDGSYPDSDTNPDATMVWSGPLRIEDRTPAPPVLARLRTEIDRDRYEEGETGDATWDLPAPHIHKSTVVRLREPDGPECVAVFFVGEDLRRDELPVIHLSTDPDHLFGDRGIYVPGRVFEDHLDRVGAGSQLPPWGIPANYLQRGRDWERPAEDDLERAVVLHHFEPGGELGYQSNVGVRIHGGATRAYPQKSLRLYARNDYGARTFEHPFFGADGSDRNRRLLLRNSGNDCTCDDSGTRSHLLDGYVQSLMGDLRVDTLAYQPAAVFINGEYWGIKNLRERYDRHYLAINHGADPDEVVILDAALDVDTGEEGDDRHFRAVLDDLDASDPADDATLEQVAQTVDIENLIDYLVAELFVANTDWPHNNVELWRERGATGDHGSSSDGRWRWLLYDLDQMGSLFGVIDVEHDRIAALADEVEDDPAEAPIPFLFDRLTGNAAFRDAFVNRFADLLNTTFAPDRTVDELDRLARLLEPEIEHQLDRWNPDDSIELWHDEVEAIREFMTVRPDVQREQLDAYFDLGGSDEVTIRVDPGRGSVRLNSLTIDADTIGFDGSSWTGEYFAAVPLEVEAVPATGHRFTGWAGQGQGQPRSFTVELDGPLELEPVFEPR